MTHNAYNYIFTRRQHGQAVNTLDSGSRGCWFESWFGLVLRMAPQKPNHCSTSYICINCVCMLKIPWQWKNDALVKFHQCLGFISRSTATVAAGFQQKKRPNLWWQTARWKQAGGPGSHSRLGVRGETEDISLFTTTFLALYLYYKGIWTDFHSQHVFVCRFVCWFMFFFFWW